MKKIKKLVAVFLVVLMGYGIFAPPREANASLGDVLTVVTIIAVVLWGANEGYDLQEKWRYSD